MMKESVEYRLWKVILCDEMWRMIGDKLVPPWDLNPHLLNRSELYLFELGGSVETVGIARTVVIGKTCSAWCTWHKTHFSENFFQTKNGQLVTSPTNTGIGL